MHLGVFGPKIWSGSSVREDLKKEYLHFSLENIRSVAHNNEVGKVR